jgi:hypothetical protein
MGSPYWGWNIFLAARVYFLYLLPLYIIFNVKFVGKDPLEETVGTRSYAIGSGSHTEQEMGSSNTTRTLIVPQAALRMLN